MGGLYNLLHGVNEDAPVLLAVLNIDSPVTQSPVGGPWRSGRFRDIYLNADGTRIILYTRNGGGNREHWANDTEEAEGGENCACPGCTITYHLPQHPNYIRDWDDEFDSTYAYVEFSVPEHAQEWMRRLATGRQPETVHQKFERVTAEIKNMTPEQIEADPRFSRLAKQLVRAASEAHSRQPDQPQSDATPDNTKEEQPDGTPDRSVQRQR